MPELPEVETLRRGLLPRLTGEVLAGARVRDGRLRWPVPADLDRALAGARIEGLARRGKYLLLHLTRADSKRVLIVHLGMSGSLLLVDAATMPTAHDHLDLLLADGRALRLRDPRRFGCVCLADGDGRAHPLLARLGIEPLSPAFDGAYLHRVSRRRLRPIKLLLMDGHVVAGIGNIYACEALFAAGIDPRLPAERLSRRRCERLAEAVKTTLARAIDAGGSSLRDFVAADGRPGYFQMEHAVYGRAGEACRRCGRRLLRIAQQGRGTFFCPGCQR